MVIVGFAISMYAQKDVRAAVIRKVAALAKRVVDATAAPPREQPQEPIPPVRAGAIAVAAESPVAVTSSAPEPEPKTATLEPTSAPDLVNAAPESKSAAPEPKSAVPEAKNGSPETKSSALAAGPTTASARHRVEPRRPPSEPLASGNPLEAALGSDGRSPQPRGPRNPLEAALE
jgi:hypothetical protein